MLNKKIVVLKKVTKEDQATAKRLDEIKRYLEACPQVSDPKLNRAIVRARNLAAKNLTTYVDQFLGETYE